MVVPGSHVGSVRVGALLVRLQHAVFLLLVAVGVIRSLGTGGSPGLLALAVVALLGWYAAGLALARGRHSVRAIVWLLGLTALWAALVLVSHENIWVAVSLWLLAGHFLRTGWAIAYSIVVLVFVLWAQRTGMPWSSAMVIGPTVGMIFSLALSLGQHRLVREGIERQHLVDSLLRAQQESEALHAELVAAQRESGILAERTRLSRDIHDGIAQTFSSILLTARAALAAPPEATGDEAGAAADLAAQRDRAMAVVEASAQAGLEESRRVVAALAPHDLADTGLTAALRRALADLTAGTGIATDLQVDGELTLLPTAVEVALLRVAQGALANVRQHADASRVVVTLTDSDDSVRLDIVDDGQGFDLNAVRDNPRDRTHGGYGLQASRDRLRELGGGLDLESAPGEGTALTAYLPLNRPTEVSR